MLLDESPLIVHCSFKEWIGFVFHPHSLPARWLKFYFCHRSLFFSFNDSQEIRPPRRVSFGRVRDLKENVNGRWTSIFWLSFITYHQRPLPLVSAVTIAI
ncbi:hypothetical protein QUA69_28385 [Microcoleus sp. LAD1_D1]|uniref:hypothetical protein n=1 Tax=Microcoleus sp. LAD1_D1 TaxID=2818812 RepID=UPI002FD3FD1C